MAHLRLLISNYILKSAGFIAQIVSSILTTMQNEWADCRFHSQGDEIKEMTTSNDHLILNYLRIRSAFGHP